MNTIDNLNYNIIKNLKSNNENEVIPLIQRLEHIASKGNDLVETSSCIVGDFGNKYRSYSENIYSDVNKLLSYFDKNFIIAMKDLDRLIDNMKRIEEMTNEINALTIQDLSEQDRLRKDQLEKSMAIDTEFIESSKDYINNSSVNRNNSDMKVSLNGDLIDKFAENSFYYDEVDVNPEISELKNKIVSLMRKQNVNVSRNDDLISTGHEKQIENTNLDKSLSISMELEDLLIKYEELLKEESSKFQYEMNNIKVENPKRNSLNREIKELESENRRLIDEINELSIERI